MTGKDRCDVMLAAGECQKHLRKEIFLKRMSCDCVYGNFKADREDNGENTIST